MHLNSNPPRIFYGWWIVGASFVISLYIGGIIVYGFTAIIEPVAKEFGWSYAQISLASSIRGMETGLLSPIVGIMVDRWGPRRLMFVGAIITGLGLVLLSRVNSLGMFWGAFGLIATGLSTCTATVMMTTVANWFREKIGLTAGIVSAGYGFAGLLLPLVVKVVDSYDWRMAMVIFGIGMWLLIIPLSLLFRRSPQQYGYRPYGEVSYAQIPGENLASVMAPKEEFGAKQVVKSSVFWHIALALMLQLMVMMAVITHVMPYLSSVGIDRATSSWIASAIPLTSIGGRLSFGWFCDRFDTRRVALTGFAMMSLGLLLFSNLSPDKMGLLAPFLIFFCVGYGGLMTIRVALLMEHFGRGRFGTVHGFTVGVMQVGSMAGAPVAGWVYDSWGSYQGAWFAFVGLLVVALIIMAAIPASPPQSRAS